MRIRVLGSAAGGGFPQWNCGCPNCRGVRDGTIRACSRTQECVAVSADGDSWILLNASPEIRAQIESFASLHPRASRHSPIAGIVLTSGDLDHCLGLFSLRESHPLTVYATGAVQRGLTENNVLYRTLERFEGHVTWRRLEEGREIQITKTDGRPTGLLLVAAAVPGKLPIHLERAGVATPSSEVNVGLRIRDEQSGRVLAYVSSTGRVDTAVLGLVENADCVFFDGTFWSENELVDLRLGTKRAADMAHLPIGGDGGSLARLRGLRAAQRIFIHVNNTNPILRDDSREAAAVRAAGWQIAADGIEIEV
ncbi:MAG TPA: pyrroloquinoline quinone biosynthesis protein PqqB [Candidatus Binatia bacterium]|nr:pyrroloquinoline quinone biosynthesis protein PqqB [Candidatus Binatia bacterium]